MVFLWNLSNSKSPRVSRTLLSILINLNNAVVLIVFISPPISNSSSPLSKPLEIVSTVPITIAITINLRFHIFFYFSGKVPVHVSLFVFFDFYFVISWDAKIPYTTRSLPFLLIPENGMRHILQEVFWFVHIPFASMIKFQFLA